MGRDDGGIGAAYLSCSADAAHSYLVLRIISVKNEISRAGVSRGVFRFGSDGVENCGFYVG